MTGQPAGVRGGLAVVGHAEIFVPRSLAGERQLFHGVRAIGVAGVAVQKSLEVSSIEKLGQLLPPGCRNLTRSPKMELLEL